MSSFFLCLRNHSFLPTFSIQGVVTTMLDYLPVLRLMHFILPCVRHDLNMKSMTMLLPGAVNQKSSFFFCKWHRPRMGFDDKIVLRQSWEAHRVDNP